MQQQSNQAKAETSAASNTAHFSDLLEHAIYGVGLNTKKHVIATNKELVILRRCSELLHDRPDHSIHIVAAQPSVQTDYLAKTLIHLGVSSGRIKTTDADTGDIIPDGLWLFVAENSLVNAA